MSLSTLGILNESVTLTHCDKAGYITWGKKLMVLIQEITLILPCLPDPARPSLCPLFSCCSSHHTLPVPSGKVNQTPESNT